MRLAARVHLGETGRADTGGVGRFAVCLTQRRRSMLPALRRRASCRVRLLLVVGLASVLLPADALMAQRVIRLGPVVEANDPTAPNYFAAVLHPSEEATTLLSRAQEGVARKDWKLVVDSLQRIIDLPGDHILATTETKYESARQHAQRQLGTLAPEGLRAYRLIYDGEAAAIFSQATEQHDEAALRRLVDRSFITSHGDDAAVTLADWLIDEGRFLEAGAFLRQVKFVYPDSDLPAWAVPVRWAVCLAGVGRIEQAKTVLDELGQRPEGQSPEGRSRIEQVRGYLGRVSMPEPEHVEHGWPMAYGRSSRDGLMSPVEPTFVSHLPWQVPLPVPPPKSGIKTMEEYAAGHQLIPMAEITTNGQVIVVKSGANLLGLDRDTFDPLWTTRTEEEQADLVDLESGGSGSDWRGDGGSGRDRLSMSPQLRRLYYDSVGSQLCLAAGMAMTVEWPSDPPDTLAARLNRGVRRHNAPMAGSAQSFPNFVVAYALENGQRVWTSDTSSGTAALGPVEFLAAPITVEDMLFVPCRLNDDMYAVLLDPQTGKIVRHIYLCGTGGGQFDSLYACTPAVADGTVFVPTGRGVLIAIDVATWSIQWVVRYDHVSALASQVSWLPTPAIAVADVVLLAAADTDELLCFDRAAGELRWHSPREKAIYVLSAGDGMVWTVGEESYAIDLETGKQVWSQPTGSPAGRGARSGDRLYLPTRSGMHVLRAATGERADERLADVPAGNLLAYEDSLYVVSAFEIRKYPDMKRGYDQAVLAQGKNRADMSLSMRLAWLEYLRGEPAKALAALSEVPDWIRSRDEKRYSRFVHLKVLAMLELAGMAETPAAMASDLLRQAQQIAETPEDSITARLALGEHHARGSAEGSLLDACLEYAALAFDATGDAFLSDEGDAFEGRAGLKASRRLADLLPKLSAEQTATLTASLRQRLSKAIETRDMAQLRRFANCTALARLGVEAELALAIWAAKDLSYEQAEACLQRVIDRAASPDLVAEAVARLAVIHLQPGELQLPVSGTELIRRLEREFADVQISTAILDPEWSAPVPYGKSTDKTVACSEAAKSLRKRVDEGLYTKYEDALSRIALGGSGKPSRATPFPAARPLVVRGDRREAMCDRVLLFVDERTVEARRVDDGELLWPAELRLLGEMVVESRITTDGTRFLSRMSSTEPARGLVSGQTLIVNTRFGIHAVGLRTGRRLWSRRFDPPSVSEQSPAGSDACIWVHNGYMISVDSYGRLEVARRESGADVLWRRRMLDRKWQTVRAYGEFLVVGDAALQQVDVFRLSDGTHLGVSEFIQQPEADRTVNIAVIDNAICGPVSPREVAAMELKTPGLERWRIEMEADLAQVCKPSEDTLAIADRSGRIKLINTADGSVKLNVHVPAVAHGVVDSRIDAGVLFVVGLQQRFEPARGNAEGQQWSLAAIRLDNGEILWTKTDLGPQMCVTGDALVASSNAIPLLIYRAANEARVNQGATNRARLELVVLDKSTGAQLGDTVSTDVEGMEGVAAMLDLQVWPGYVTAFVGTNLVRFDLSPPLDRPAPSAGQGARSGS
jgi:outer membrane protein assembly factor BamB/predicted negative regulator of RcsB-dependent stress response